jgi:hypothetical protein
MAGYWASDGDKQELLNVAGCCVYFNIKVPDSIRDQMMCLVDHLDGFETYYSSWAITQKERGRKVLGVLVFHDKLCQRLDKS